MTDSPIFIGGLQRTGTSLMRALVGAHPDVAMFPKDLHLWTRYFGRYRKADLRRRGAVRQILGDIFASDKFRDADSGLEIERVEERVRRSPRVDCAVVFQCLLEEYAEAVGRPRWGLKTPRNEFHAQDIFRAHPDAGMVQMIRDPRDVALSQERIEWGGWRFEPEAHISLWRESLRLSRENEQRFAGSYLTVRFEDLVEDPASTIQGVCEALRLDYDPVMLDPSRQRGWRGNSSFDDVGADAGLISNRPVGRYRTAMSKYLLHRYQTLLEPELKQCRYPIEPLPGLTSLERISFPLRPWSLRFRSWLVRAVAATLRLTPFHDRVRDSYRRMLGRRGRESR